MLTDKLAATKPAVPKHCHEHDNNLQSWPVTKLTEANIQTTLRLLRRKNQLSRACCAWQTAQVASDSERKESNSPPETHYACTGPLQPAEMVLCQCTKQQPPQEPKTLADIYTHVVWDASVDLLAAKSAAQSSLLINHVSRSLGFEST